MGSRKAGYIVRAYIGTSAHTGPFKHDHQLGHREGGRLQGLEHKAEGKPLKVWKRQRRSGEGGQHSCEFGLANRDTGSGVRRPGSPWIGRWLQLR